MFNKKTYLIFIVLFILLLGLSVAAAKDNNTDTKTIKTTDTYKNTVKTKTNTVKSSDTIKHVKTDKTATSKLNKTVTKNITKNKSRETKGSPDLQPISISTGDVSCNYGDVVELNVTTDPAGVTDGIITWFIDDDVVDVRNLSRGTGSCMLDTVDFDPGVHEIMVDFGVSTTYDNANAYATLTINHTITLTCDKSDLNYNISGNSGDTVTLSTSDDYARGNINVYIDNTLKKTITNVFYDDYTVNFDNTIMGDNPSTGTKAFTLEFIPRNSYVKANNITGRVFVRDVTSLGADRTELVGLLRVDGASDYVIDSVQIYSSNTGAHGNVLLYIDNILNTTYADVCWDAMRVNFTEKVGVGNHSWRLVFQDNMGYTADNNISGSVCLLERVELGVEEVECTVGDVVSIPVVTLPGVDEGTITWFINERSIASKDLSNSQPVISYDTSSYLPGTYTVRVAYASSCYENNQNTTTLVINKYPSRITNFVTSFDDDNNIRVVFNIVGIGEENIDYGIINVYNGSDLIYTFDNDAAGLQDISFTLPGRYNSEILRFEFEGDEYYPLTTTIQRINLDKKNITITTSNTITANISDIISIPFSFNDTVNDGKVSVSYGGSPDNIIDISGNENSISFDSTDYLSGEYTLLLSYYDSNVFNSNTTSVTLYLYQPTSITADKDEVNVVLGEGNTYTVNFETSLDSWDDVIWGSVDVYIDDQIIDTLIIDDETGNRASIVLDDYNLENLAPGTHTLRAVFTSDDTYTESSMTTVTLNIEGEVELLLPVNITVMTGDSIVIPVNATFNNNPLTTGVVTFYINNTQVGTLNLGTGNHNITVNNNYNPGTYAIRVDYNDETGKYRSTSNSTTLYVRSTTTIATNVLNNTIKNTTFSVSLMDARGNTFDGLVNITLPNGSKKENIAVTNGIATITFDNLVVGSNTFIIEYPGNTIYDGASSTLNIDVVKLNSTTTAIVTNTSVRNTTITVSVVDEKTGTPVTSGNVEIINTADNTVVGRGTLDNTGTTSITTTLNVQGNYNLRVDYKGNDQYNTSSALLDTITVTGRTSQTLTNINNNTFGNTSINVSEKDPVTDTIITNAPVTITLPNGTTINTNTGEGGNITVFLDIPVGNNNILVEFAGNDEYNTSSTTTEINVQQRASTTTAIVTNSSVRNVTVEVTVVDKTTQNPVTSGNVEILDKDGNVVGTGSIDSTGKATITTNINSKDVTEVTVNYLGNTNYTGSQYNIDDLVVVGRLSDIEFTPINTTYANTSINITTVDPVTGDTIPNAPITITYPDGTTETASTDANGNYTLTHTLPVGENTITVEFTGNDEYNSTTKTYTFTVTMRESSTTATITNNTIRNTTIEVTVTDQTTGEAVTNGNIEIVNVDTREVIGRGTLDGTNKINITTNIDTTGSYNLRVDFKGNTNYTSSSYTLDAFNVEKRASHINTTTISNIYQDTSINITVTDPITGETITNAPVTITLPNETTINRITDENGTVTVELDLSVGYNTLTITYTGNEDYNSTTETLTVNVVKRASNTQATVTNATIRNTIVNVTVTDQVNGNPVTSGKIIIKDTNTGNVVGRGTLTGTNTILINTSINSKGTYNLQIEYLGNDYYNSSSYTLTGITVTGRTSTIETNINNQTTGNISINITVKDPITDTPIANAEVNITYPDGTTETHTTDKNGNITIKPDLPVGDNTITIEFPGNNEYNGTTETVTINVEQRESKTTAIIANNTVRNTTITVTVTDKITGEGVTSGEIEVTNTLTGALIATGTLTGTNTVNITLNQPAGTYNITVNYLGNTNYTGSSTTITDLKVEKRESTINITTLNDTITDTRINITVYDPVTDEIITNAPITITLPDGTTINTHTGNTGTITQTLTLTSSDNTITVIYDGNQQYNSSTTTHNIDVKKLESIITVTRQTGYIGENITLTATITDANGNKLNGGKVAFKLNDVTIKYDNGEVIYTTVTNGKATISYFIPYNYQAKTYKLSAVYSGNNEYQETRSNTPLLNLKQRQAQLTLTTNNNIQTNNNITLHVTITDKRDTNRQVNGYIIFKIDGLTLKDENNEDLKIPITDNTVDFNYTIGPEYSARQHTITAILENNTYVRSQANNTFNVTQTPATINLAPLSMTPNTSTTLTGTITDTQQNNIQGTNKLAVKIDGTTLKNNNEEPQYHYIENGQINIPLTDQDYTSGEHTLEVVTGERNIYTQARTTTTLTVTEPIIEKATNTEEKTAIITNKEFVNIQTTQTNTQINETNQITITLTDSNNNKITTGTITWKQNGKTLATTNVNKGISKLNYKFIKAGTYTITAEYTDTTNKYQTTSKTFNITVIDPRITTTITSNNQKTLVGDTITYTITTCDEYQNKVNEGTITTKINGQTITNTVNNGITVIPITINKAGTYQITNTYTGTKNYQPTTNTKTITVNKKTPKLTIQPITATAGTQTNVTIKVTTQDNTPLDGKITIKLLNTTKTITAKDGQATTTVNIPLTQATKNTIITATYQGNNYYNNKTVTSTFIPTKKATKITINTIKPVTYTQTTTITGKLTDNEGKILKNTTITINVANKTYKTNTNNQGIYNLTYKPTNTGKYIITVAYLENQYYTSSKAKTILTVNKQNTKITINKISTKTYQDKITIKGKYTDNTGTPLKNTTIRITINGKTYTNKTNQKGEYTYTTTAKTPGKNNITVNYPGNTKYNSATNKTTFTVNKQNTKLTINKINTTKKGKTIKITGTLTNQKGQTLKNTTITIKINKKTYTTKTNNKGTYTLNYKTSTIGTNNITVTYKGNSKYKAITKKTTFKVAKT